MPSNSALRAVGIGAAIAALCTTGCKKTTETERRGAEAGLHAARVAGPPTQVIGERNDLFATVRREQLELRARLQRELRAVDDELAGLDAEPRDGRVDATPKSRRAKRIKELQERRARLHGHEATVERADERGWNELKAAVEKDLIRRD